MNKQYSRITTIEITMFFICPTEQGKLSEKGQPTHCIESTHVKIVLPFIISPSSLDLTSTNSMINLQGYLSQHLLIMHFVLVQSKVDINSIRL